MLERCTNASIRALRPHRLHACPAFAALLGSLSVISRACKQACCCCSAREQACCCSAHHSEQAGCCLAQRADMLLVTSPTACLFCRPPLRSASLQTADLGACVSQLTCSLTSRTRSSSTASSSSQGGTAETTALRTSCSQGRWCTSRSDIVGKAVWPLRQAAAGLGSPCQCAGCACHACPCAS